MNNRFTLGKINIVDSRNVQFLYFIHSIHFYFFFFSSSHLCDVRNFAVIYIR